MNKKASRRAECEARILRIVNIEPMSLIDIASYMDITRSSVSAYLRDMHERRLIHVHAYQQPLLTGTSVAIYAPGDKPDFVRIVKAKKRKTPKEVTAMRTREILDLLSKGNYPASAIAMKVGLGIAAVLKYLQRFRKEHVVRLAEWHRASTGKHWVPYYGLGDAPDAELPPASGKSSRARCGSRALGDDKLAQERSRATVEQTIAAARAKPCGIFAALGI